VKDGHDREWARGAASWRKTFNTRELVDPKKILLWDLLDYLEPALVKQMVPI